jgi:hypothetical protein
MREKLVTELVKEVLGPRGGINETLNESPLNEFITGVLAPKLDRAISEIDSEAAIPTDDTRASEEETADVDVDVPPFFYPALDPKSRPSTMGLSFLLEATGTPEIHVCLTWARYRCVEESKDTKPMWLRTPRYSIFELKIRSNETLWIDESGKQVNDPLRAEISFHVIFRPSNNCHFVSLYLVNRIKVDEEQYVSAEHYIYQPQIRVVCGEGTKLVPGISKTPKREEEQQLEFLYRNRPVYARGHLCSVVWKDVDPEKDTPSNIGLDFPESHNEPPFAWQDGAILPPNQQKRFACSDVRTEFVPIYSIPFPELGWQESYGRPPELSAHKLSEMWEPDNLRNALSPIAAGYEKWIGAIEKKMNEFLDHDRTRAQDLIEECRTVLERIKSGIEILCAGDDVRLSFCFANKAIDTQWKWSRKSDFMWRPFQIAFILMALESIVNPKSKYRGICDLLWVPTGAGKTEAYLAIVAFTIAYRRRKALERREGEITGAGVSVITRYTLRLLTIQQFRRTLSVITACEYLRTCNLLKKPVGWRPAGCPAKGDFLWGSTPFMIGLWVGGKVTPNRLSDTRGGNQSIPGALSILKRETGEGEPAQVLNCPACNAILAVPQMGLQRGGHVIHFVVQTRDGENLKKKISQMTGRTFRNVTVKSANIYQHNNDGFYTLTSKIEVQIVLKPRIVDNFWEDIKNFLKTVECSAELISARASRPGYFIRHYSGRGTQLKEHDFEVFCTNPECQLQQPWAGGAPTGWTNRREPSFGTSPDGVSIPLFPDGNRLIDIQEPFVIKKFKHVSDRIPIPALTVDEQIYRRLPTIIVATVDKFARPPFEPKAAALFGNVGYHHCIYGYYRCYQPSAPQQNDDGHPVPTGSGRARNYEPISHSLEPPNLVIQDELHLIEGPLGSLVGIYETAVDFLCQEGREYPAKYVASTATIRRATEQVQAIFVRGLQQFPPHGLISDDKFFIREKEIHALDDDPPGRLYLGICAPGRGPLTPIIRMCAKLLQTVWQHRTHSDVDMFWTLTGYFNAVRELAGARALYRQDIPQRVKWISGGDLRRLDDERGLELSSRTSSTDLPSILDILNNHYPEAPDALFTTSMFGTGVDIPRIGLMVVNGQPKTTSAYIQSTGRVGRSKGALVVTFFRATRPRDLSHYEFFIGYHRQLHRFVEPITVYPFSSGVLERAAGPTGVFLLRNMRNTTTEWHKDDTAPLMAKVRTSSRETRELPNIIDWRAGKQPRLRTPTQSVSQYVASELDRWMLFAANNPDLKYVEYAISDNPHFPVVLGDYQHQHSNLGVVYKNAPQSLRDIEETTGFQTWGG